MNFPQFFTVIASSKPAAFAYSKNSWKGYGGALRSRQTPPQLKDGLRRREAELEAQIRSRSVFGRLFGGQKESKPMAKLSRIHQL